MGPETSAILLSAGTTAAVAAVGAGVLAAVSRERPARAALGAPFVVVASLAAGVAAATRSMLIGEHDYRTVLFVLMAGAPMAVLIGIILARRVSAMERSVARERAERERDASVESGRRETIRWLSHDLRTPLSGIRLIAEDRAETADPGDSSWSTVIREADRMATMIDDIAELSRLHGDPTRARDAVPLADIVSDAVASIAPLAAARRIRLEGEHQPGPAVQLDVPAVTRAVTNLLRNAVQHSAPDSTVHISAHPDGRSVEVTDSCGGIPTADLPHVFEAGWRGDHARTSGQAGMGLGLAIVREVARSHGGDVRVSNTVDGRGCTFTLTLLTDS